jgi:hypothetical protein
MFCEFAADGRFIAHQDNMVNTGQVAGRIHGTRNNLGWGEIAAHRIDGNSHINPLEP